MPLSSALTCAASSFSSSSTLASFQWICTDLQAIFALASSGLGLFDPYEEWTWRGEDLFPTTWRKLKDCECRKEWAQTSVDTKRKRPALTSQGPAARGRWGIRSAVCEPSLGGEPGPYWRAAPMAPRSETAGDVDTAGGAIRIVMKRRRNAIDGADIGPCRVRPKARRRLMGVLVEQLEREIEEGYRIPMRDGSNDEALRIGRKLPTRAAPVQLSVRGFRINREC